LTSFLDINEYKLRNVSAVNLVLKLFSIYFIISEYNMDGALSVSVMQS